jgi:colanic acid/amylovoran biosynthesis glycosyltransferase
MISFSHYSAKNDISGVTTWLQRFLLRLHHDGIPVSLLLHHFGNNAQESSLLNTLLEAGISVEIEPQPPYSEEGVRSTLAFLNRNQPQVFLPQCLEAMYYAAGIAGRVGLPWAMTLHSDDPVYWAIAETIPPETNGGMIVGVSDYICQLAIEKRLASLPQPIPCGVPVPQQTAAFVDSPFRVAFSGRVVETQKRISLVLEAMAQACHLDSRIKCLILGDGDALSSSRQWVMDRDLGDRIHFLGRLEQSAVQAALVQCQAFLLMSDFEGLPIALLEAMAIGVVPVVRDTPSGIPELVREGETGLLVSDKPEQAALAIVRLANNPSLWSQYSNASKALVAQNYSEDICYQRWLSAIDLLSDRCTVRYPIPITRKILLPPLHPSLIGRDRRKPSLTNRAKAKLSRIKDKVKRLAIK